MVLYSCCSTLKICASRRMMPYECVCMCVYMCLCAMNALRLLFCISSTAYRPTWAYNETALDSCISLSLCPLLRRFFIPLVNDENSYITPSSTILRLWNNRISHFYRVFFSPRFPCLHYSIFEVGEDHFWILRIPMNVTSTNYNVTAHEPIYHIRFIYRE